MEAVTQRESQEEMGIQSSFTNLALFLGVTAIEMRDIQMPSMTLTQSPTVGTESWARLWGADEARITEMISNSLVKKAESNSATLFLLR